MKLFYEDFLCDIDFIFAVDIDIDINLDSYDPNYCNSYVNYNS